MKKSLVLAMAMALGVTASAYAAIRSATFRLDTGLMTASPSWQLPASSKAMATTPSVATV